LSVLPIHGAYCCYFANIRKRGDAHPIDLDDHRLTVTIDRTADVPR
jgi:hypothetical protein